MAWAPAIIARGFPRRAASQRQSVATEVSLVGGALWANGTSPVRSARFPWRVFPERRFPALASVPGATPAHAASRAAVPKRLIAVPISATSIAAPRRSTPGMVSHRVIAWSKGKGAAASTCGARPTADASAATGTATVSVGVSARSRSAMVVSSVAICSAKKSTLNFSQCVARKHWLKCCVSPPCCGANVVKIGEPYHGPLVHLYANDNQLQTPIN